MKSTEIREKVRNYINGFRRPDLTGVVVALKTENEKLTTAVLENLKQTERLQETVDAIKDRLDGLSTEFAEDVDTELRIATDKLVDEVIDNISRSLEDLNISISVG